MNDLLRLKELINQEGEIPVDLKMGYAVTFSTLTGNLPVNNRIHGTITGIPVQIKLFYNRISGSPVNVRAEGYIGDSKIKATLSYSLTFSTAAGTIPINDKIIVHHENNNYPLDITSTQLIGSSRGAKGSGKSKKVVGGGDAKYVGGQLVQAADLPGGGGGIAQDTGIPIPSGIYGFIEGIEIDIGFKPSYYFDTGSGKTPINVKAIGYLRNRE